MHFPEHYLHFKISYSAAEKHYLQSVIRAFKMLLKVKYVKVRPLFSLFVPDPCLLAAFAPVKSAD